MGARVTTAPLFAILIRSWHLVDPDSAKTLCGLARWRGRLRASELPGDERTCERCAVIAAKRAAA